MILSVLCKIYVLLAAGIPYRDRYISKCLRLRNQERTACATCVTWMLLSRTTNCTTPKLLYELQHFILAIIIDNCKLIQYIHFPKIAKIFIHLFINYVHKRTTCLQTARTLKRNRHTHLRQPAFLTQFRLTPPICSQES